MIPIIHGIALAHFDWNSFKSDHLLRCFFTLMES